MEIDYAFIIAGAGLIVYISINENGDVWHANFIFTGDNIDSVDWLYIVKKFHPKAFYSYENIIIANDFFRLVKL